MENQEILAIWELNALINVAEQLAEQLHIWLVFIRGYKYGLNDQICGYYPKCSSVVV